MLNGSHGVMGNMSEFQSSSQGSFLRRGEYDLLVNVEKNREVGCSDREETEGLILLFLYF